MQGASSFEPLFVNEEGQPYRFYIWNCAERKRVKELIEVRFGEVTKDPEGDYTIQLADPKTRTSGEVYSVYYITECCSLGKLLDLRKYRINPTSKYGTAFCPMDVLQGHITWKDADVFSLENENSPNKSIPLSEASSKRRKFSGSTSTDEEVQVIQQFGERQRRTQSSSQCTPNRGIKTVRRRRSPYKLKEKQAIVQYLKDQKACKAVKGTAVWKSMEEDKVCANRTWQSLKEHFLKHILPLAEAFDFSTSEVAVLKKITSGTRRKDCGDNNAASQDSDDDDVASFSGNRYIPEEDEAILKFISHDRRYLRAGGIKIWQRMERKRVVPGRSWQSLKERYRKNLVHRLNTYVNKDELHRMETWIKGSSRSAKGCTCCAKSKSPASTSSLASGDTSITSSSPELNTSDSQHHKRKLFTQYRSPVQFTPVSDRHHSSKVPEISTLAKEPASCMSHIQSLTGNTVQHKAAGSSPNCKGNAIRKAVSREVVLAGKKKILPTVGRNTVCVENKKKTTPAVWMQNDRHRVNHSSSSSTETSVVANCGTLGEKDVSAVSETSSASEGQKFVSSTSSDIGLGTSDINKEFVPEYNRSTPENENRSEHGHSLRTSQETIVINPEIVPSTTALEVHTCDSQNSFHESDFRLQQMADTPMQNKQSDSTSLKITANTALNISSSSGGLEGSDTDCSPEKKEPVSPSNCTSDKPQDGMVPVAEPSSIGIHLHEQLRKPKLQEASCLEPLSCTDTVRVDGVGTASTLVKPNKHHKKKLFMHCNSPVAFTPLSGSERKPPVPESALLARNIQSLCGQNTVTTDANSDSSKRQKKAVSDKYGKHKDSAVASKIKRVDKIAKRPEKFRKLKKLHMTILENGKEKDHLMSPETSSVRNNNNRVAHESHKNPFLFTSLDSFISKYKSKSRLRNMNRSSVKNRKKTSDDSGHLVEPGGTQAFLSCSKNSDINYSAEANKEAGTSMQEKETIWLSNQGLTLRKTKHKQKSSFKDKKKSSQIGVTDVKGKIKDKSRSQHTEESLKSNKNIPKITAAKDNITILDLEEIIPKITNSESTKSSQEILSEHSETLSDPNETIHALTSSIDQNKNDSSFMPGEVAINIFSVFQGNDNGIIFPYQVLENKRIPMQNDQYTEVDEGISVNPYKKTPANDISCQVGHSPSKQNALEKITYNAVQVCEISNSNVDMIHTQTNSSFNSISNTSKLVSSQLHNPHYCLNAGSIALIYKNAISSLFKGFPNKSTENPESVLCNESDNESEHTHMSEETSQHFESAIPDTPEFTDNDADQKSYDTTLGDQVLVSFSDISCSNQEEDIFSFDLVELSSPAFMSGSSQMNKTNSSHKYYSFGQEKAFEHVESLQSLASEPHSMGNEVTGEASYEMWTKDADNELNNGNNLEDSHPSNKTSVKKSVSTSRNEKAYISFLNHLNNIEVETFNIVKTVDEAVNTLLDSPNTLPGSEPGTSASVIEETKPNTIYLEGQSSFHVVLDIKEEPDSSSVEMETFKTYIDKEHDYCMRMEGIKIKEECEGSLYDSFKVEDCVI